MRSTSVEGRCEDSCWDEFDLDAGDGAAENGVDYLLTGGNMELGSSGFWFAAGASVIAGFVIPLLYNYIR